VGHQPPAEQLELLVGMQKNYTQDDIQPAHHLPMQKQIPRAKKNTPPPFCSYNQKKASQDCATQLYLY